MKDATSRPHHGCYQCRREAPRGKECLRLLREQRGCSAYPDCDVKLYECTACNGLWLGVYPVDAGGAIMNIREDDAMEMFPGVLANA